MSRDGRVRSEEVALKFGRNLFRCRRRAAMSQEELGNLAQLHRTEIGMLEHGTRLARVDTLMKIAGALSVSPTELLEGIHWTPGNSAEGRFSISDRSLPRRRRDGC
ncbi:MAG TPA: helix-turn-helix transcriptional regulator [Solirubrobacterales bacterium]|jgi:transcriptional regulator with XRE-family HTH domain|nr:helix-turn-helix transcriptional regulator [Solirubrobacterales bacterium]